ncbi:L,D-transpeptidase family protein [Methylophaga sp. OBS4]|uniref:L,D-transpeptidase family protein n=1 Tax=Methylophaga sp. OBS4 TaxID=2991935 RepID=UPI002252406D|nr:L,D-transpeptidase [Methylophaga sp. OBS4]MCX4186259.1 L,D-transpeptidase [Methylophaga sp. OBS4]
MKKLIAVTLTMLAMVSWQQPVMAKGDYELVIKRSEKRLVIQKDGVTLRSFHVALGSGGRKAKIEAGDRKTPLGKYHIVQLRDSDRFHLFLQLDYPSVRDAIRALKTNLISRDEYRAILDAHIYGGIPPQDTALGGAIGIHGIGAETENKLEIHQFANWTQGCIALRNNEIEQLMRYVDVGTQVIITD